MWKISSATPLTWMQKGPALTRRDRVLYAREQLAATIRKVAPYIFIGVGIGALIHNAVPQQWVEWVLGGTNPFAVVLATVVGVPMYADIFGTIPVAESLLYKGAGLGTVLSFMMAVTTLSLPSPDSAEKGSKAQAAGCLCGNLYGWHHCGGLYVQCNPVLLV